MPGNANPAGPQILGRGTCSESFPEPTSGHDGASDAGTAAFRRGHLPSPWGRSSAQRDSLPAPPGSRPTACPLDPALALPVGLCPRPATLPAEDRSAARSRLPPHQQPAEPLPTENSGPGSGEDSAITSGRDGREAGNARLQTTVERPAPPPRCPRRVRCPPLRRLWTGGGWGNADAHADAPTRQKEAHGSFRHADDRTAADVAGDRRHTPAPPTGSRLGRSDRDEGKCPRFPPHRHQDAPELCAALLDPPERPPCRETLRESSGKWKVAQKWPRELFWCLQCGPKRSPQKRTNPLILLVLLKVVAGARIELATQGFSVLCSTN